jgi:hypothetical protein
LIIDVKSLSYTMKLDESMGVYHDRPRRKTDIVKLGYDTYANTSAGPNKDVIGSMADTTVTTYINRMLENLHVMYMVKFFRAGYQTCACPEVSSQDDQVIPKKTIRRGS